jgi:hypothetical protein
LIPATDTYRRFPRFLETLPPLVTKQRRLAKKLAPLAQLVVDEKAVRCEIDQLLQAEGFEKGEGVTCHGYDVVHRERKGNTSYDIVLLGQIVVEQLVALGMPREDIGDDPGAETVVVKAIAAVRSVGETSKWAAVEPMKGATVRK